MDQEEIERIDKITESVYYLIMGNIPKEIDTLNYPDDEIKQLSEMVNRVIASFSKVIVPLSKGVVEAEIPDPKRLLSFHCKQLHSSFRHWIWQIKQVAEGDYSQRVDFMEDFSEAFNSMITNLKERTEQLEKAKERLAIYSLTLEQKVEGRTKELEQKNVELQRLFISTIQGLSNTLEAKDKYTKDHSTNVANYAVIISEKLNFPKDKIELLRTAGLLHDIGKIGIEASVLNKLGSLTKEEYEQVKKHPVISACIVEPIKEFSEIISSIRHHHESFDGSGYPDALKGEDIPLGARILAIADAYDAMNSNRPYRNRLKKNESIKELIANKGIQFDPRLVDIFIKLIE